MVYIQVRLKMANHMVMANYQKLIMEDMRECLIKDNLKGKVQIFMLMVIDMKACFIKD